MNPGGAGERGFTLLLAALVASIVLALGAAIYSIAQKQVLLSSLGRDSQFAFYAADTAAECALYWDFRFEYFATSTPSGANPTCDTHAMTPFVITPQQNQPYTYPYTETSAQMSFFADTSSSGGFCAQVAVTKSLDPTTRAIRTVIHADGYNVSCANLASAPQALQRTVELHY